MNTNQNPYAMQDANFARMVAAMERDEAERDWWDEQYPDWRELSRDPEVRDTVAYNDVQDPEGGFIRRYGSDDPGRYFPGASGE